MQMQAHALHNSKNKALLIKETCKHGHKLLLKEKKKEVAWIFTPKSKKELYSELEEKEKKANRQKAHTNSENRGIAGRWG